MKKHQILLIFLTFVSSLTFAQTGITIGPPRVYYTIGPGQSHTEKVTITNPSKDFRMDLGISLEDWQYSALGENEMFPSGTLSNSCAAWVTFPETYFSIGPGESKVIDVQMSVPSDYLKNDSGPVKTVMLFVTQLNARDGVNELGASIKFAVRTGIKLYQRLPETEKRDIEITDFKYNNEGEFQDLHLYFNNYSNTWTEALIHTELLNTHTGEKTEIPAIAAFLMPGDKRLQKLNLPEKLSAGEYIATTIIDYGDAQKIRIAELEFKHGQ